MKLFTKLFGLATIAVAGAIPAQAQNPQPILTMRSGVAVEDTQEVFKFTLTSTEKTTVEVEVNDSKTSYEINPGSYNATSRKLNGVEITCTPGVSGVVNVYGDASKINGLESNGYQLEAVDLHQLSALTVLDLDNNSLGEIDITANTALVNLTLAYNSLTQLDLSQNAALESVKLDYNNLRELPLVNNPNIQILDLSQNYFNFVTLPEPLPSYTTYRYEQKPIVMNSSYDISKPFNFKAVLDREGTTFSMTPFIFDMFTDATEEIPVDYYMVQDKYYLQFTKEINDSVFVKLENSLFPNANMRTENFALKVPGDDAPNVRIALASTQKGSGEDNIPMKFFVGIKGASPENPVKFYVDFSGGKSLDDMTEYDATSEYFDGTFNIDRMIGKYSGSVTIYTDDEVYISSFVIKDIPLYYLDPGRANTIEELIVNNCALDEIDLSYNTYLRHVDLSNNKMYALNLLAATQSTVKKNLVYVDASHNEMTQVALANLANMKHVDLSHNMLKTVDLSGARQLDFFNASNNIIEEIDLSSLTSCGEINISHNELNLVLMPLSGTPDRLDLSYNNLGIALLPRSKALNYIYAPQAEIRIPKKSPTVDLREQYRVINGEGTRYEWYKADGTPVPSTAYEMRDGATSFKDSSLGSVYCMMSHPAFPDFSGDLRLASTKMTVAPYPTNVITDFKSLESNSTVTLSVRTETSDHEFYVDWEGDGFLLDATDAVEGNSNYVYTFVGKTVANTTVKLYSANDDAQDVTIFALHTDNGHLDDADMTKLVNCSSLEFTGAKAKNIKMPANPHMFEILLDRNELSEIDLSGYPELYWLNAAYNKISSFDFNKCQDIGIIELSGNPLNSVELPRMNSIWQLGLGGCGLESIDVSGLPSLNSLYVSGNNLTTLDISKNKLLRVLVLGGNKFDFNTLPLPQTSWGVYYYVPQQTIEFPVNGSTVDMSSQLWVGTTKSEYTWWYSTPYWDSYYEMWIGDELERGVDYEETDGVTTFLKTQRKAVGMVTNEVFPKLGLMSQVLTIDKLSVDNVDATDSISITGGKGMIVGKATEGTMDVYDISGVRLATCPVVDGSAVCGNLKTGIYVARLAGKSTKVIVK